jgi:hypothetical protein
MDTIAFKRHKPDAPGQPKQPTKTTRTMSAKSAQGAKKSFPWWIIVLIVLAVAITGLIILRFSRASEQSTAPLTADQLKAYVQTQLANQDITSTALPIDINGYGEFRYGNNLAAKPAYVSYYIDDVPVARSSTSPFSFVIDTSRISNGTHTLTAVAFDSNGQPLGATQRTINVNNNGSILNNAKNIITYPWYWLFQL